MTFLPDKDQIVCACSIKEIESIMTARVDHLEGRLSAGDFMDNNAKMLGVVLECAVLMNSRLQELQKDVEDMKSDLARSLSILQDKAEFFI